MQYENSDIEKGFEDEDTNYKRGSNQGILVIAVLLLAIFISIVIIVNTLKRCYKS